MGSSCAAVTTRRLIFCTGSSLTIQTTLVSISILLGLEADVLIVHVRNGDA